MKATRYLVIRFIILLVGCFVFLTNYKSDKDQADQLTESDMHEKLQKIEKNYEAYIEEVPKDVLVLRELVRIKYTLEKYEEAIQLGLELIDLEPDNHMNYYLMANTYTKLKDWDSMIKYREKSFEIERAPNTLYYLSVSYLVKDATYALQLLNELEMDDDFFRQYKHALHQYIEENNIHTIRNLIEFIPHTELMDVLIKRKVDETTSANEIVELEKLRREINAY